MKEIERQRREKRALEQQQQQSSQSCQTTVDGRRNPETSNDADIQNPTSNSITPVRIDMVSYYYYWIIIKKCEKLSQNFESKS